MLGKITSSARSAIQNHVNDANGTESMVNGDNSSPYMSNAVTSSPTSVVMAPTGDGVSVECFLYSRTMDEF